MCKAAHAAVVWIQLAPRLSDSQLAATQQLSAALVDSVSLHPLPLAARKQWRRGAKMINNDWQALGVGLLDTREIVRTVASNITSIDLPPWLWSEPSCRFYAGSVCVCYLADLLDLYRPSRALRSTNSHLLAVPSCPKSSFASRAFCVSSPYNWNSLPLNIRSSDSLATFQSRLKSHLFASAYHL